MARCRGRSPQPVLSLVHRINSDGTILVSQREKGGIWPHIMMSLSRTVPVSAVDLTVVGLDVPPLCGIPGVLGRPGPQDRDVVGGA